VLHSAGWGDVLLAQLDADGNHLWSRRAGDPGHQEIRAIAAAPDGGLVIAGGLEGSLDLGAGLLVSAGSRDAFVASLDPDGDATWSHRYGEKDMESSLAVDIDQDGGVLLMGNYYGSTIDLGGGPLDPGASLFFAELGADGSHAWSTALSELVHTFDRGADGTLVVGGFGTSELMFPDGVWGGARIASARRSAVVLGAGLAPLLDEEDVDLIVEFVRQSEATTGGARGRCSA